MRLLVFLLSILNLTLSCLPCNDAKPSAGVRSEISQAHEHNQDRHDQCNPFCICSCCGSHYVRTASIDYTGAGTQTKPVYISFISSQVIKVSAAIWQPPRA